MEELGWNGICIEPNPDSCDKLLKTRNCAKYNIAFAENDSEKDFSRITGNLATLSGISEDYHPMYLERIKDEIKKEGGTIETIKVKTLSFDAIMANFRDTTAIDYISIDTEGNEFKILKSIDFQSII